MVCLRRQKCSKNSQVKTVHTVRYGLLLLRYVKMLSFWDKQVGNIQLE